MSKRIERVLKGWDVKMTKITFDSKYKNLTKVASDDVTRQGINRIIVGNNYIAATNGFALVRVPARVEGSVANGFDHVSLEDFDIAKLRCKKLTDIEVETRSGEVQSPLIEQVIPAADRESRYEIAIDVELLLKVAKALGETKLRLRFGEPLDAIEVTPCSQDPGDQTVVGVVMPFRADLKPRPRGEKMGGK